MLGMRGDDKYLGNFSQIETKTQKLLFSPALPALERNRRLPRILPDSLLDMPALLGRGLKPQS